MSVRPQAIPCLISAVVLLIALGQHPYGHYQTLRWIVGAPALIDVGVGYRLARVI